jgi:hypothetical protein
MTLWSRETTWLAIPLCVALSACGGSSPGKGAGSGGTPETGGTPGTGGTPATGGVPGTGGALTATGGVRGSGGVSGTGGLTATGGIMGTGGLTGPGGAAGKAGSGGAGGAAGKSGAAGATGNLTMYYLDVTGGRVMTSDTQNPKARVLVASAGQGPDGVAVDVAGGHVYWTGMGSPSANDGFIMRADLDGSNVKTLVPAGGTFTPKQMKLDVAGGKMYWSDREGMRVMRANLDGSGVEALVTTGQTDTDRMDESRWCVGVSLDLAGGTIYWSQKGPSNGGVGSLRRAHLTIPSGQTSVNRTDIEVLYDKLPEPIDIDLDLGAGYIYWTDRADNTVSRAPIEIPAGSTAATRTDRQILVKNVATAIGVALDLPRGKVYYTSGANGALGRANLDGTQNEPLIPMAGNLTGIALGVLP